MESVMKQLCTYVIVMDTGLSVTRLGDLLHFEQLFKACGNNYFTQIAHISVNFCKGFEIFHFSNEIIFGRLFTGHTAARLLS